MTNTDELVAFLTGKDIENKLTNQPKYELKYVQSNRKKKIKQCSVKFDLTNPVMSKSTMRCVCVREREKGCY